MIASILIAGGNIKQRREAAEKKIYKLLDFKSEKELKLFLISPDFVSFNKDGSQTGIEHIRELQSDLNHKPYCYKFRVAFINEAHLLTIPAQNAFLKTIEEPPSSSALILSTKKKSDLLPTIVSRCQIVNLAQNTEINLSETETKVLKDELLIILAQDLGMKFKIAETQGKNKEQALEYLEKLTIAGRDFLLHNSDSIQQHEQLIQKLVVFLKETIKTKKHIEANVNPRFALENLFLTC